MKPSLTESLYWTCAMLCLAAAMSFGKHHGLVDGDLGVRVLALNGLVVAWYANRAPKVVATSVAAAHATRVVARALVLGGLAYTLLWAFAPVAVAAPLGTGALALSVVVTFGYCRWQRFGSRLA